MAELGQLSAEYTWAFRTGGVSLGKRSRDLRGLPGCGDSRHVLQPGRAARDMATVELA